MTIELNERVANLERQMEEQVRASSELTQAVNDLTNVLTSGKLTIRILCYFSTIAAGMIMALAWLNDHVKLN
jgi:hypothetical protein